MVKQRQRLISEFVGAGKGKGKNRGQAWRAPLSIQNKDVDGAEEHIKEGKIKEKLEKPEKREGQEEKELPMTMINCRKRDEEQFGKLEHEQSAGETG